MHIVLFCHSLLSDWNHGNAHFLRGVVFELVRRGARVDVYEPRQGWSLSNLLADHGPAAIDGFYERYPGLSAVHYDLETLSLDDALEGADLVLVHEWNEPELVRRIGEHKLRTGGYVLLFHDTHHRLVTQPDEMRRYDLSGYDGVLAFGEVLRRLYLERGLTHRAYTWHEAADVRVFAPRDGERTRDLVWIGNWGDDERTTELHEFLLEPVRTLGVTATVHGVRYPPESRAALTRAGATYSGWIANYHVPEVFATHKVTVHVPRGPYVRALPGVPTIRVFEALACGIPLISAPWQDAEGLFEPGEDFLVARDGAQMRAMLRCLLHEPELRRSLAAHGLQTIHARHTCAHRVDELFETCRELGLTPERELATSHRTETQGETAWQAR